MGRRCQCIPAVPKCHMVAPAADRRVNVYSRFNLESAELRNDLLVDWRRTGKQHQRVGELHIHHCILCSGLHRRSSCRGYHSSHILGIGRVVCPEPKGPEPMNSTTADIETAASTRSAKSSIRPRRSAKIWTIIGLIFSAAFAVVPVLWMFVSSLKPNTQILLNPPSVLTSQSSFTAYARLFRDPSQLRAFGDSYLIGFAVTLLTIVVAVLAGYALSRGDFPGRQFVATVVVGVQSVPPISLVIPYLGLITVFGLYDSFIGLILTTWF